MEEEEDDDIYAPEDAIQNGTTGQQPHPAGRIVKDEKMGEDLEEGEEEGEEVEEEESDSVCGTFNDRSLFSSDRRITGYRYHYRAKRRA